jgi:hypothetical protein
MQSDFKEFKVRSHPPVVDVRSSVIHELRVRHAARSHAGEWAAWAGLILAAGVLAFFAIDLLRDPFAQVLVSAWETTL